MMSSQVSASPDRQRFVYIETMGCQERLRQRSHGRSAGVRAIEPVDDRSAADLIIATRSVRDKSEHKMVSMLASRGP